MMESATMDSCVVNGEIEIEIKQPMLLPAGQTQIKVTEKESNEDEEKPVIEEENVELETPGSSQRDSTTIDDETDITPNAKEDCFTSENKCNENNTDVATDSQLGKPKLQIVCNSGNEVENAVDKPLVNGDIHESQDEKEAKCVDEGINMEQAPISEATQSVVASDTIDDVSDGTNNNENLEDKTNTDSVNDDDQTGDTDSSLCSKQILRVIEKSQKKIEVQKTTASTSATSSSSASENNADDKDLNSITTVQDDDKQVEDVSVENTDSDDKEIMSGNVELIPTAYDMIHEDTLTDDLDDPASSDPEISFKEANVFDEADHDQNTSEHPSTEVDHICENADDDTIENEPVSKAEDFTTIKPLDKSARNDDVPKVTANKETGSSMGSVKPVSPLIIKPVDSFRREPRAKMSMSPFSKVNVGAFNAAMARRGSGPTSPTTIAAKSHSARKSLTDFTAENKTQGFVPKQRRSSVTETEESRTEQDSKIVNDSVEVINEVASDRVTSAQKSEEPELKQTSNANSNEIVQNVNSDKKNYDVVKPKSHTARKSIPKARKSLPPNSNKITSSGLVPKSEQDITQVNLFPIANVTLKLPEIEKVLGTCIKPKTIEKCLSPVNDKKNMEQKLTESLDNITGVKLEAEEQTLNCNENGSLNTNDYCLSSQENMPILHNKEGSINSFSGSDKINRKRKRRRMGTYDLPKVMQKKKYYHKKPNRLSLPDNLHGSTVGNLLNDSSATHLTSFELETFPNKSAKDTEIKEVSKRDVPSSFNKKSTVEPGSPKSKLASRYVGMVSLLTGKTTMTISNSYTSSYNDSKSSTVVSMCDGSPSNVSSGTIKSSNDNTCSSNKSPTELSKQSVSKKHFKVDYSKQRTISQMLGSTCKKDLDKCETDEERSRTLYEQLGTGDTADMHFKEGDETVAMETPPDSLLDLETNSQGSGGSRRSLRKRKAHIIDDDSISVVSTVPSTADSDASSVHSVKGKRSRASDSTDDYASLCITENDCSAPILTPQKMATMMSTPHKVMPPLIPAPDVVPQLTPRSPLSAKGRDKASCNNASKKLDSMIYTHPLPFEMMNKVVHDSQAFDDDAASVPHPLQGSPALPLAAKNGQRQPMRYMNTPNGVSYPVTPPKTPDTSVNSANSPMDKLTQHFSTTGERDFIPLCCCKIKGGSFTSLAQPVYCQALDSVDGKVIGCFNKVSNGLLVRPAVKVPFMAVCEVHRRRLKLHQCCPGCGHFCSQGKFYQCKQEGGSATHHFHRACQVFKDNKYFCPHCGEESSQYEVLLHMSDMRVANFFLKDDPRKAAPRARMTVVPSVPEKLEQEVLGSTTTTTAPDPISLKIPNSERHVSSNGLPFGPSRSELERILNIISIETEANEGNEETVPPEEKDGEKDPSVPVAVPTVPSKKPKKLRYPNRNLFGAAKGKELDKIVWMLSEGYDPNFKFEDNNNQTALHAACTGGALSIVHCLIQAGASPHTPSNDLRTPFMCAAENNHVDIMKYLFKCAVDITCKSEDGMTAIHMAAKAGHLEAVRFLIQECQENVNVKDDGGWTPIIWASEYQHEAVIKYLLSQGGDPNLKDNEENTALHWAAFSGSVGIAELFLNAGCNLENANEHGDRPLHIAARQDHYECVVLFLARSADSEARNNENEAPISCCIDQTSPTWMALRVNRQLKGFATKRLQSKEQLLHRDVSFGKEPHGPIPCVNAVDTDGFPTDYLYVIENVETTPMNINRVITSLQACKCKDDCSSIHCLCSRNSVKCWYDKEGKLLKDFNQVEPPLLFECNKACQCWTNCNNRVVQNGITCRLQLFKTDGRGWGVRSLLDIPAGLFICEYIGELISDAEADRREDDSYLFDLDNKDGETYCIDARKYGNISRFINHLCEPNLIPVRVFVEHQDLRFPRICFFSSREIKAGEELGFDYGEKFWIIKWKQFTCACGSAKCKYSKDTIQRTIQEYNKRQAEEAEEEEEK